LIEGLHKTPRRFIIVDDSGSMATADGHMVYKQSNSSQVRIVSCSRWEELTEAMRFHAGLADAAKGKLKE
jgi:hypothetical protein